MALNDPTTDRVAELEARLKAVREALEGHYPSDADALSAVRAAMNKKLG